MAETIGSIPHSMSVVISQWIDGIQAAIPSSVRESQEWSDLVSAAANSGRDREKEQERLAVLLGWMWGQVLPLLQPVADQEGFGEAWEHMLTERTYSAADATRRQAASCPEAKLASAVADAAAVATADVAAAAATPVYVTHAVCLASGRANIDDFWRRVDPVGQLRRLVEV